MKKSLNQTSEGDSAERNALTRKLYRYISEAARRVDEGTARGQSISDLFSPSLEVQRQKLRDNCEKLVFADPLLYGCKAQELLWRKGYYDVVTAAKRLRPCSGAQQDLLLAHMEAGVGHYHHLIFKAQVECGVELAHAVDYAHAEARSPPRLCPGDSQELRLWARAFVQACLISLGDLCRYRTDYEGWWEPGAAHRYYAQAALVLPCSGMPYNQLGTLYTGKNYHLDSVRYYLACLSCDDPFHGGEGNLLRIFDKNSKQLEGMVNKNPDIIDQQESVKFFICKFLSLVDGWFFEKELSDFNELCNSALYHLKECLQFCPPNPPAPDLMTSHQEYAKFALQNEVTPEYLNPNMLSKIMIIIFLCMDKLQKENSSRLFPLKAFTFAILSQVLLKLQTDLVDIGFEITDPSKIINSYKEKIRKRKNVSGIEENNFFETTKLPSVRETNDPTCDPPKASAVENISHLKIIEPTLNKTSDSSKSTIKMKKTSILQKLRRRRRRIDSFDSSDKTASEDLSDESNSDSAKSSGEESSSEGDEISVDSYSTATSSDEGSSNPRDTKNSFPATKRVESSHNYIDSLVLAENKKEIVSQTPPLKTPPKDRQWEKEAKVFNEESLKEFLENDNILMALHLLLNWLYGEVELIVSCGPSGRAMFQALVDILNTVHRQIFPNLLRSRYILQNQYHPSLKPFHQLFFASKYSYRTMPLIEDYEVRNIKVMEKGIKNLKWGSGVTNVAADQANAMRLLKFVDFGIFIVKLNIGIVYNKRLKLYILKKPSNKRTNSNSKKHSKPARDIHHIKNQDGGAGGRARSGSLMKSLGRLWLSEQVRALESEVRAGVRPQLPGYAVLDAEALCQQTHLVRQLVASRKLIVLVPTIVLQTMDSLKKESGAARSAIRWLEVQLRNGSRFIRTQRPSETAPLPLLKYPKKMHRDVQNFIQVIEFCHFFLSKEHEASTNSQKYNGAGDGKEDVEEEGRRGGGCGSLVLLTGSCHRGYAEQKDFSYSGLAQSAGVAVQSIQEFSSQWRHCLVSKQLGSKKR